MEIQLYSSVSELFSLFIHHVTGKQRCSQHQAYVQPPGKGLKTERKKKNNKKECSVDAVRLRKSIGDLVMAISRFQIFIIAQIGMNGHLFVKLGLPCV